MKDMWLRLYSLQKRRDRLASVGWTSNGFRESCQLALANEQIDHTVITKCLLDHHHALFSDLPITRSNVLGS